MSSATLKLVRCFGKKCLMVAFHEQSFYACLVWSNQFIFCFFGFLLGVSRSNGFTGQAFGEKRIVGFETMFFVLILRFLVRYSVFFRCDYEL